MNFTLGQLFAIAGADTIKKTAKPMRSYPCVLTLIYELFIFMPAGIYLLMAYSDWSLMYFINAAHIPMPVKTSILLGYPVMIVLGFYVSARLIKLSLSKLNISILITLVLAMSAISLVYAKRLLFVGTNHAFKNGSAVIIYDTHLFIALVVIFGIAIPVALYTLFLARKSDRSINPNL